jgi:hypothetical protein
MIAVVLPKLSFFVMVIESMQDNSAASMVNILRENLHQENAFSTFNAEVQNWIHGLCKVDLVKQKMLEHLLQSAKTSFILKPFELPFDVILDGAYDLWTASPNGLLTSTGKPRRDKIRERFVFESERLYANRDATTHNDYCAQTVIEELQCMQTFKFNLPGILEFEVNLPSDMAILLRTIASSVGPESVQHTSLEKGWGGYILQAEHNLPCYPNSNRKDYINFRFQGASELATVELNEILDVMREETLKRRKYYTDWITEVEMERARAKQRAENELLRHSDYSDVALKEFLLAVEEYLKVLEGNDIFEYEAINRVFSSFQALQLVLTLRLKSVRLAYDALLTLGEHPLKLQSMNNYSSASEQLRIIAPRLGVR